MIATRRPFGVVEYTKPEFALELLGDEAVIDMKARVRIPPGPVSGNRLGTVLLASQFVVGAYESQRFGTFDEFRMREFLSRDSRAGVEIARHDRGPELRRSAYLSRAAIRTS